MDGTVLIADDDRTIRTVLTQALTRAGCKVHATGSLRTLARWVDEGMGDAVITDVMMPDGNGLKSLEEIRIKRPMLPVIVISAQNTIMTAIKAAEAEAFDYLPKPFDLPDLMTRVNTALKHRPKPVQADTKDPSQEQDEEGRTLPLVGHSPKMQDLFRLVARVMKTDLPILLTGESGTGKTVVAQSIHDLGGRQDQPMITVSAASLDQLEDDAACHAGTIVFDEITDFDHAQQAKILHFIERNLKNGPRFISTCQPTLEENLTQGAFRKDLYYRLNGMPIRIPPLRERSEDIPALATYFLEQAQHQGLPARHLSEAAIAPLMAMSWPGNLRQLQNMMRQLAISASGLEVEASEVDGARAGPSHDVHSDVPSHSGSLSESVYAHLQRYFVLHGD
ncbi:MAG: response regulator, partial [Halocynthiibacter sp.]